MIKVNDHPTGEVIIYQPKDGKSSIEVKVEEETVWLNQKQLAQLFGKDVKTINEHIGNIYKEAELEKEATIRKFQIVQKEGKREVKRNVEYYNLDLIISVGYRVKSKQGIQFRIWATRVLKEHLIQGFTLNEKRLKSNMHKTENIQILVAFQIRSIYNCLLSLVQNIF